MSLSQLISRPVKFLHSVSVRILSRISTRVGVKIHIIVLCIVLCVVVLCVVLRVVLCVWCVEQFILIFIEDTICVRTVHEVLFVRIFRSVFRFSGVILLPVKRQESSIITPFPVVIEIVEILARY